MLPIHKLEKLPRHQRLRKILKELELWERRLCGPETAPPAPSPPLAPPELRYLGEMLEILRADASFDSGVAEAIASASEYIRAEIGRESPSAENLRRPVNTIRHLLRAETGKQTADWDFIGDSGALDPQKRRMFPGVSVYLEDVRSPFNVGALFRSAESFGAERIYLSPFCADPDHPRSRRSAMGCTDILPWERRSLDELDGPVFALESGGRMPEDFHFPAAATMIVGSEELGVSPEALSRADASLGRLTIPLYGAKGSLNVSVAFGIAMYLWSSALAAGGRG